MEAGRARGRARGRGRLEGEKREVQRRPCDFPPQPVVSGGRAVQREAQPFAEATVGLQGGRATANREIVPAVVTAGRAATHRGGMAGPEPVGARPLPSTDAGGTNVGVGRGASRGHEQRNVVFTRPTKEFSKIGIAGEPRQVMSNYFEVLRRPDMHLLQYRVDFVPELDHMGLRKMLLREHAVTLGKYLFDGTLLYGIKRHPEPLELMSVRKSDNTPVQITLRLVGEIQKEDVTYTSVMNIILRRCMGMLDLVLLKRDFFDKNAAQEIPSHNLNIWPGYLTTIKHHEEKFLLCVEVIHKVLRRDTALDVLGNVRNNSNDFQNAARAELEGKVVMTHYNNKTYRIDDIDFSLTPKSTFHLRKEDKEVSFIDYYKSRYNLTVRSETQPMLISRPTAKNVRGGSDEPIYLIPELCGMTGLSDSMRSNFTLMKDVAAVTRVNPDRRVESLMKFHRRLYNSDKIKDELNSWGLTFADQLVNCNARVIPPQTIIQDRRYLTREGDWSREITNSKMCAVPNMNSWIIFHPTRVSQEIRVFVKLLIDVGRAQNFMIPEPKYVSLDNDRAHSYVDRIRNECMRTQHNLVLAVLMRIQADTYGSIKKLTCCELGIPSQVITQGKCLRGDQRKMMSIATKVMIQMAAKLGGEPWRVALPTQSWMVIGYDTYHDAKRNKAVGAFVASVNQSFTRYASSVLQHENCEEISASFRQHFLNCLKIYRRVNQGRLPSKLFIYRDGIGIGDIARVKELEIQALRQACAEASHILRMETPYAPAIAYIIVSKRINTRFFSPGQRGATNPPCGLVCDNTVTLNERFDFFLVSQKANQGTVSPTSFNVIEDTTGTSPDVHQKLAYVLTHLYYNWPGTLRVPAPCQYAHKLAYLIGESIMQIPHDNLACLPYYL